MIPCVLVALELAVIRNSSMGKFLTFPPIFRHCHKPCKARELKSHCLLREYAPWGCANLHRSLGVYFLTKVNGPLSSSKHILALLNSHWINNSAAGWLVSKAEQEERTSHHGPRKLILNTSHRPSLTASDSTLLPSGFAELPSLHLLCVPGFSPWPRPVVAIINNYRRCVIAFAANAYVRLYVSRKHALLRLPVSSL